MSLILQVWTYRVSSTSRYVLHLSNIGGFFGCRLPINDELPWMFSLGEGDGPDEAGGGLVHLQRTRAHAAHPAAHPW